jgi:hypothetical protein
MTMAAVKRDPPPLPHDTQVAAKVSRQIQEP